MGDRYTYIDDKRRYKVILMHTRIQCQACAKWKPASEVGLRTMTKTGNIRNQSWCEKCRSNYAIRGVPYGLG